MRYRDTIPMLNRLALVHCILLLANGFAVAGEPGPGESPESAASHMMYGSVPSHQKTEGELSLGFRWLEQDDSSRVGEYQYLHSSVVGGFELNSYPLPHRINLMADYQGKDNMYGDLGYAYKDLILFRDIFSSIHHNLDHYSYQYAGTPPTIRYTDRNPFTQYHTGYFDNFLTLRLKAPDFPFHIYLKQRHIEKDGTRQQRSMIGYYGNITQLSQNREIDWQSDEFILGANSHLGLVEADYAFGYTRFDPGANSVLHDAYPLSLARPADTYPHDSVPRIESWANTLKVHTSYTGRIVASASLSNLRRENVSGDAESTTWRGATDFKWMPFTALGLIFKYRHSDIDVENPGTVTLRGLANSNTYSVLRSISSKKDTLSLSANYRPFKKTTIVSTYEFEHLARNDFSQWAVVPESTESNAVRLALYNRPLTNLNFRVGFLYRKFHDPACNIEPDTSGQIQFAATYQPTARITALIDYNRFDNERDLVRYNDSANGVVYGGGREDNIDRILGSLSFGITRSITLSTSAAYQRNRIEQTLGYGNFLGGIANMPFLDPGVSYRDEARYYGVNVLYIPRDDISLSFDVSRTDTKGEFLPNIAIAAGPVSLASFSSIRVTETQFLAEMEKKIGAHWEIDLQFKGSVYNDRIDNGLDGRYYSSILSLTRRF